MVQLSEKDFKLLIISYNKPEVDIIVTKKSKMSLHWPIRSQTVEPTSSASQSPYLLRTLRANFSRNPLCSPCSHSRSQSSH